MCFSDARPKNLNQATLITSQLWGTGDAIGTEKYASFEQRHWLEKKATFRTWMGGCCYGGSEAEPVRFLGVDAKFGNATDHLKNPPGVTHAEKPPIFETTPVRHFLRRLTCFGRPHRLRFRT